MKRPENYPLLKEVLEACEASTYGTDNPGFCLACGIYVDGVEPDARAYFCEACEEKEVYGAEEVLLIGAYKNV